MHEPQPMSSPLSKIAAGGAPGRYIPPQNTEAAPLGDHLLRRLDRGICKSVFASHRATQRYAARPHPKGLRVHSRGNRLLDALPLEDYERLWPALEFVALPFGHVAREAGCPARHGYFPVTGIVTLTQELASGATAEVAVAGNEGMIGTSLFMGGEATTGREIVRGECVGYRIRADLLRAEFERCRPLRNVLLRYAQFLITQIAQTAVCRGHHDIEEQVCRFLLTTLDRSPTGELALTHQCIAQLLGVRRESVTATVGRLQAEGAIRCSRCRITVVDRQLLERRACECYSILRDESARLIPRAERRAARQVATEPMRIN
ncbi:MAG: Crp/Fnr family transcriptional regulator [Betaproteobacteria bacterium]